MPRASRAWVRVSSSWSPSCRNTIAVDDIASAPPMTMAAPALMPYANAMPPKARPHSSTCRPPMPSTSDFIATMRASENSSPSVKTRNTTPISASTCTDGGARHEAERMRAEHHADQQVTQDRWQLETAHQAQHEQRAREQDQYLAEKVVRHRASRGGCADASIPSRHSRPWRSTRSPDRSRTTGQPPSCRSLLHSRPAWILPTGA